MKGLHMGSPVFRNKMSFQNTAFFEFQQIIYVQNVEEPKILKAAWRKIVQNE